MLPSHAKKYLGQYSCPESRELPTFLGEMGPFDLGLALPLRGESALQVQNLLKQLEDILAIDRKRLLVVAVLNESPDSSLDIKAANQALLEEISGNIRRESLFTLETRSALLSILWVDRSSLHPFSSKQGVGLARKIGCDILCALISQGHLQSPWLWTTDADAFLPKDYFSLPESTSSAVHYTYQHDVTSFLGATALILYEIHLRHYFLGLHWAKSPFAYPTIGSCLAIHPSAYVQVRGFPDRLAGEDFHLLNKLRKLSPITYRRGSPITLTGRFSQRVPFGTGQSTIQIFDKLNSQEPFCLYDWRTFECLRDFLNGALKCFEQNSSDSISDFFSQMENCYPGFGTAVKELQCEAILQSCFDSRNTFRQRTRHFHTVFDALKTLRFIHLLDRHLFPKQPWDLVLKQSAYLENGGFKDPKSALHCLKHLDEQLTQIVEKCPHSLGNSNEYF